MMRPLGRFGLGLALGMCAWAASVGAQDLVAPRVRSLPGVEVPAGIDVPESGVVQVRVRIDPDGKGVVEKCDAGRALCDVVIEAIARAEFEPATRDGNPVPSQVRVDLRLREPGLDDAADSAPEQTVLEPSRAQVEKELVFSETAEVDARAQAPIKLELEGDSQYPGDVWRAVPNLGGAAGHRSRGQRATLCLRSRSPTVGDGVPLRRYPDSAAVPLGARAGDRALGLDRRRRSVFRCRSCALRRIHRRRHGRKGSPDPQ